MLRRAMSPMLARLAPAFLTCTLIIPVAHAGDLKLSKEDCLRMTDYRARWVNQWRDRATGRYIAIDQAIPELQKTERDLREMEQSANVTQAIDTGARGIKIATDATMTVILLSSAIGAVAEVSIADSAASKVTEKVENQVLSGLDKIQDELDKAEQNADWELARMIAKYVPFLKKAERTAEDINAMLKSGKRYEAVRVEVRGNIAELMRTLNSMRADRDRSLQRATALAALEDKIDRACPGYTSASRNQSPMPGAPVSRPQQIPIQRSTGAVSNTSQCSGLTPELMDRDPDAYDELSRRCEVTQKR